MIEPELALLQMQVKGRAVHAAELDEPSLRHALEALDAVDVRRAARELVAVVAHPSTDKLGKWTNGLIPVQVAAFAIAVVAFLIWVVLSFGSKL